MIGDVVAVNHRRLEPAGGDVDPGEAHLRVGVVAAALRQDGNEPVAPRRIEEHLVGSDARRDHPRDLAAHQPLGRLAIGRGRPVDLFADRDMTPGSHELHQLRIELVVRKAGHRQGIGALVAAGECEVEQVGGRAGVVAKELVEVAHPEEHQCPRAAGLRRLELLHHGGRGRCHGRKCINL